jgi:hypothetical protein
MLHPAGLDPHFFVEQGLADRQTEYEYLRSGLEGGGVAALAFERDRLLHFDRGATWDAQRIGGMYHPEFVDYATVAIGLYAAAAGYSRDEILAIEDHVARGSQYDPKTRFDETYKHLPKRNVANTDLGYSLFRSGGISARHEP